MSHRSVLDASSPTSPAHTGAKGHAATSPVRWNAALGASMADIAALIASPAEEPEDVVDELLAIVVKILPSATAATLVERAPSAGLRAMAATDALGADTDAAQLACGHGTVPDAALRRRAAATHDLAHDPQWPGGLSGDGVARSAISVRLHVASDVLVLSWYSATPHAFTREDLAVADTVAGFVQTALAGLAQRRRAHHLHKALMSNRRIGVAVGILMAHHRWTEEQAFTAMSQLSQRLNVKVIDIASEVTLTGVLPADRSKGAAGTEAPRTV